jgi:hypothetical protein
MHVHAAGTLALACSLYTLVAYIAMTLIEKGNSYQRVGLYIYKAHKSNCSSFIRKNVQLKKNVLPSQENIFRLNKITLAVDLDGSM